MLVISPSKKPQPCQLVGASDGCTKTELICSGETNDGAMFVKWVPQKDRAALTMLIVPGKQVTISDLIIGKDAGIAIMKKLFEQYRDGHISEEKLKEEKDKMVRMHLDEEKKNLRLDIGTSFALSKVLTG